MKVLKALLPYTYHNMVILMDFVLVWELSSVVAEIAFDDILGVGGDDLDCVSTFVLLLLCLLLVSRKMEVEMDAKRVGRKTTVGTHGTSV